MVFLCFLIFSKCDLGYCRRFAGSEDEGNITVFWGPDAGWIEMLIASVFFGVATFGLFACRQGLFGTRPTIVQ